MDWIGLDWILLRKLVLLEHLAMLIIALIKVHHILGVTMSPCPAVSNDKEDQSATLTGPLVMSKYLINAIPLYFPGPHMFLLKFCAKS